MIAIVKSSRGNNIASIAAALHRMGASYEVTEDARKIREASRVILAGVGHAAEGMAWLKQSGLNQVIPNLQQPLLGICLGMQLLYEASEEGNTDCLGVVPGRVVELQRTEQAIRVPHIGWNTLEIRSHGHPLLDGVENHSHVYFVHSFAVAPGETMIAETTYGQTFASIVGRENFYGCQFHPEKSSKVGETILHNFLSKDMKA